MRTLAVVMVAAALQGGPGPIVITGLVRSSATGMPLANARVMLPNAGDTPPTIALTDQEGRFSLLVTTFPSPLSFSKPGYGDRQLSVGAPGRVADVLLEPAAVIVGRVVDEAGEPVLGARVSVEASGASAGGSSSMAETDDHGEYRIGGLAAGAYVVLVRTIGEMVGVDVRPGQTSYMPSMHAVYYPGGVTREAAQPIALVAGAEQPGIDFVVPLRRSGNQPFSVMRETGVRPVPASQPRADARASVRGAVHGPDGQPLPHAQVVLNPLDVFERPVVRRADGGGQYGFDRLAAGRYRVSASKAGHFPSGASAMVVTLKDAESRDHVDLTLRRWSVISGQVLDEFGDPVQAARVQVLQLRYESGRRQLVPVDPSVLTNDLGEYRLYGLRAGHYIVSAQVGAVMTTDLPGYAVTYYPGTPAPAYAHYVSTRDGGDVVGIDIALERTRTAHVRGRILGADGAPTMGGNVMLVPSRRSSALGVAVGARLQRDGTFEFRNVPPGQYVIQASFPRTKPSVEGDFGSLAVTVTDRDIEQLVLQMSKGASVTGRVRVESTDPSRTPSLAQIELVAVPVDLDQSPSRNWASAAVDRDGPFALHGLSGPRRLDVTKIPAGWALKDIFVNGIEVTDRALPLDTSPNGISGVDVVLTDRVSTLAGRVTGRDGRAAASAPVVVFSVDHDRWYDRSRFLRLTHTGEDGTYSVQGLPFGRYAVIAPSELPSHGDDAWQDPAFLETAAREASWVTLRDGERTTLDLRRARP